MLWSAAEYFYPYFGKDRTDWSLAADEAFRRAAQDSGACEFLETLRRLAARLHDGHAYVSHACDSLAFVAPIRWTWIGDELVVRSMAQLAENGPHPGDVILTIDGQPTARRFEEVQATISSATPQWARYWSQYLMSLSRTSTPVRLEYADSAGALRTVVIPRIRARSFPIESFPDSVREIRPGIFYIDLGRIDDDVFEQMLPRLVSARGIVFDVRLYPRNVSKVVLAHLIDRPVLSPLCLIPILRYPDRVGAEWDSTQWTIDPEPPRIQAPVAFLIDGRAISWAETLLSFVENNHLGMLVGEPTAGADGNVASFMLPGGYEARFSGMRVLKPDGSPLHGIGILPTVPVSPTRSAFAEGRDRLLEEAIDTIGRTSSGN
jgi:C-terminal processing protease CtpA/Prc